MEITDLPIDQLGDDTRLRVQLVDDPTKVQPAQAGRVLEGLWTGVTRDQTLGARHGEWQIHLEYGFMNEDFDPPRQDVRMGRVHVALIDNLSVIENQPATAD